MNRFLLSVFLCLSIFLLCGSMPHGGYGNHWPNWGMGHGRWGYGRGNKGMGGYGHRGYGHGGYGYGGYGQYPRHYGWMQNQSQMRPCGWNGVPCGNQWQTGNGKQPCLNFAGKINPSCWNTGGPCWKQWKKCARKGPQCWRNWQIPTSQIEPTEAGTEIPTTESA